MNELQKEILSLKKQIKDLTKKGQCKGCHKTLFFYDENYLYVKCGRCKEVNQFLLDKSIK